jgi:EAL domain-containing protein (putative c-di-GMP-specific phosphodiesterase class I)/GGDEF domain-containing protein
MRVDGKKFFGAFLIFFLVVIGMGVREYQEAQSKGIENIKDELSKAAISASTLTGSSYYEKLLAGEIYSMDSTLIAQEVATLAEAHSMSELFTLYIDRNNTIRYGALTSSAGKLYLPNALVDNPQLYKSKFLNSKKLQFELDLVDGRHKLYLQGVSPGGVRFINVAVTQSISLKKISQAAIFDTIAKSLLLFAGALPFFILYRNILSEAANELAIEVNETHEKLHETSAILHDKMEEKTKELIDEGFIDATTHLPNRHKLLFDMDRQHYDALIIIHLQNLHDLTHYFGTSVCDSLRQQFAILLIKAYPSSYRLGRDEFALLLSETYDESQIIHFAQELLDLCDTHSFNVFNETITLRVRLGIDASSSISLSNADEALMHALQTTQNYYLYKENHELYDEQRQHIANAASIREAYYDGRIICYYQPIIHTTTGTVLIYETLARLIDKNGTIITPHNFLTIAKKTALYPEISREVIRQTCEAFSQKEENFTLHICELDFNNTHTVRYIQEMMVSTNTSHQIIFELSELDLYHHSNTANEFITIIKEIGGRISIDNFGADYSNLEKMIHLDIDYLKLDGSLVNKMTKDEKYIGVIRSITALAHSLGVEVIAENVENDETYLLLQSSHVDYAQGFYIAKPTYLMS